MSTPGLVSELTESVSTFWMERNARERSMLTAAAAVVMFGLVYAFLLGPAIDSRNQLEKSLPPLRQQSAEMQALSRQAATLATTAAQPPATVSRESIDSSLARRGLKAQSVSLTDEALRVQLAPVSFAGLVDWLEEMRTTARMTVVEASFTAQAQTDMVNATLTLRQPKAEQ
ncbi:MAG: type II secretion system protein M [Herminiimonas sp.]|nr:type II secretion system protein M [Herminiimonas sp.]